MRIIIIIIVLVIITIGYFFIASPEIMINKGSKLCSADEDCVVYGKSGECTCGCYNKDDLPFGLSGKCRLAAPKSCKCEGGKCETKFELAEYNLEGTDNLNIYRNEEYGFEFKYPSECFLGPQPSYCKPITAESPSECICSIYDGWLQKIFIDDNFSVANFIVRRSYNADMENLLPNKANYEIDGIPAIKVYTPESPMSGATKEIFFIKNNVLLHISMSWMDNQKTSEFLNKILSTFKFIK